MALGFFSMILFSAAIYELNPDQYSDPSILGNPDPESQIQVFGKNIEIYVLFLILGLGTKDLKATEEHSKENVQQVKS
jgi:hypothetical protein